MIDERDKMFAAVKACIEFEKNKFNVNELSRRYGISKQGIHSIVSGRTVYSPHKEEILALWDRYQSHKTSYVAVAKKFKVPEKRLRKIVSILKKERPKLV